ncbi:hypothetical protein HPB52_015805 [Rhipicephalus sanguineus]|uniref:TRAF-type domain-containing protein n=1 Tax=Rhipicephalus sanguineus TaxID=34632 RepID=A0A9D4T7P7_RHISA|nr:hypothetical protein HPB52_015805 [Rhipicephalus sanguineus]
MRLPKNTRPPSTDRLDDEIVSLLLSENEAVTSDFPPRCRISDECTVFATTTSRASTGDRLALSTRCPVHCWNEAHGCQYEGAVKDMLGHYENECTFHTVECSRCGEGIWHRDLSSHYVAGCSAPVSSAYTENPSPESPSLTLQEVSAALDELKTFVRGSNDDQMLPAVQRQVNELADQVKNQQFSLDEIIRKIGAFERVNWRPTRFVDEVPSSRVCGLCRMIPTRTEPVAMLARSVPTVPCCQLSRCQWEVSLGSGAIRRSGMQHL